MRIRASLQPLGRSLHLARWPGFSALTCQRLDVGGNYAFSNYPMYSSFVRWSYYIYLADKMGQPLATCRFALTTPGLKKIFESRRRAPFTRDDETAGPNSA